jgi:diguanylate cyclase
MKILVVEDEIADANLIRHLITDASKHAQTKNATTLKEAINFLINEDDYDVVLLDLTLPDSTGLKTLKKIREVVSKVPVVVLSNIEDEVLALEAVKIGAEDYVYKKEVMGSELNSKMLYGRLCYAVERHDKKKEIQDSLEKLSFSDSLTGLLNRKGIQQVILREIHFGNKSFAALLIDLDDFNRINDIYGHGIGDMALQEISTTLKEIGRSSDYIARVSGDEFILLASNVQLLDALKLAERIRLEICEAPLVLSEGKQVTMTSSIAVVMVSAKKSSINEVLEEAHDILSKAKNLGPNRIAFSGEMKSENVLAEAIDMLRSGKHFRTVAQPIYNLKEECVTGYEFLSRSTINGFESPNSFFNLSMEANILNLVDYHCLRSAISETFSIQPDLCRHLNMFPSTLINLPPHQLKNMLPPSSLAGSYCVEISEQQILNPSYLVESVYALRNHGVKIAIDDIGFGRSCVESLVMLNPDVVKIDKKMVIGVHENHEQKESLKRLIGLLRSLDAEIVAEGIETREELELLVSLGVEKGQGFLWGQLN